MAETVYVLCESGSVIPHDLPLPAGVADRVERGSLTLVNEDGSPIVEVELPAEDAEPEAAPPAKKAAKPAPKES